MSEKWTLDNSPAGKRQGVLFDQLHFGSGQIKVSLRRKRMDRKALTLLCRRAVEAKMNLWNAMDAIESTVGRDVDELGEWIGNLACVLKDMPTDNDVQCIVDAIEEMAMKNYSA